MDRILSRLQKDFLNLSFKAGNRFSWSPDLKEVLYSQTTEKSDEVATWSLLHEVGHALLKHDTYSSDFGLLRLEVDAWQEAEQLATKYQISIDGDHIQDCLDTYRDWLYQRSTCPSCTSCSVQIDKHTYSCFNCDTTWQVSGSRLCRAYRRKQKGALV